jgi:hypothetical protein
MSTCTSHDVIELSAPGGRPDAIDGYANDGISELGGNSGQEIVGRRLRGSVRAGALRDRLPLLPAVSEFIAGFAVTAPPAA